MVEDWVWGMWRRDMNTWIEGLKRAPGWRGESSIKNLNCVPS